MMALGMPDLLVFLIVGVVILVQRILGSVGIRQASHNLHSLVANSNRLR